MSRFFFGFHFPRYSVGGVKVQGIGMRQIGANGICVANIFVLIFFVSLCFSLNGFHIGRVEVPDMIANG